MSLEPTTRLGLVRARERGVSQQALAWQSGVSLRTIQRLEAGAVPNPNLRVLVQLAHALHVSLEDICEAEWLAWQPFAEHSDPPPHGWWRGDAQSFDYYSQYSPDRHWRISKR